jgi:hypothetical protein
MTPEQKAAFINAQVAMFNGTIAAMIWHNEERLSHGHSIAYGPDAFEEAITKAETVLGANAVIAFFAD